MYTVCPKCALTLVVTAADLRAAQGHVRCGRCRSVFNALEALSEAQPPDAAFESDAALPMAPASAAPLAVGMPAEQSAPPPTVPEERDAPQHTAPLERTPPPVEERAPEPEFALEPAPVRRSPAWTVGAVLLLVALALQIVNHYRETVATFPSVGPPLRAAYAALGIHIAPLWDVHAYEARQLGATVSGTNPHEITIRASIANRAAWPLPPPLLRVTLQDRFGRPIAARDVQPRDYLPPDISSSRPLPAGGRIDATVVFVNSGPQAVGFEIDACLPEAGTVRCAHGS